MHAAIVHGAIDVPALIAHVTSPANGATVLFAGTVRNVNDGRAVLGIEYRAYEAMAQRELTDIVREAAEQFGTEGVAVEHRVGSLELGDVSVAIAVAHPHRAEAYEANRYVIEEIKRRLPIWKLERYADGTREWVAACAHQDANPAVAAGAT